MCFFNVFTLFLQLDKKKKKPAQIVMLLGNIFYAKDSLVKENLLTSIYTLPLVFHTKPCCQSTKLEC